MATPRSEASRGDPVEASAVASPAGGPVPADVDRLLSRIVERLRSIGGTAAPGLEARLHDPDLGTLRILVIGRAGEIVQAELIAEDRRTADALSRAADRAATTQGLPGIELRVRTETSLDPGSTRGGPGGGGPGAGDGQSGDGAWGARADRGDPGDGSNGPRRGPDAADQSARARRAAQIGSPPLGRGGSLARALDISA